MDDLNQEEDTVDPNTRRPLWDRDAAVQKDGELSDSEDEGEGERRDHASHREPDTVAPVVGRRVATGIMAAAPSGPHGGGPSAHTTIPPIMAPQNDDESNSEPMDLDEDPVPTSASGATTKEESTGSAKTPTRTAAPSTETSEGGKPGS